MFSWLAPIAFLPCLVCKSVSLGKVLGAPANLHYGSNTRFIVYIGQCFNAWHNIKKCTYTYCTVTDYVHMCIPDRHVVYNADD